jgi:hypothetical protein
MTTMYLSRGGLNGHWGIGEEIVGAVHTTL